jgi:glycerophosphoryl diester phosphodiesterase
MVHIRAGAMLAGLLAVLAGSAAMAFDLQGHRGARGLAPENTLAAFARALEIGVTTLETDLAVTRDGVIVLSHDPVLNPVIVRGPDGQWLAAPGPAIHGLTLAELKLYDVGRIKPGTRYAQTFAGQVSVDGERIPTFAELIDLTRRMGKTPRFNIETKLDPDKPGETLDAKAFARVVVEAVRAAGLQARVTIQSFDWRTLVAARSLAPEIETVCLTWSKTLAPREEGNSRRASPWLAGLDPVLQGGSVPRTAALVGCGTWSPFFRELTAADMEQARAVGLKVMPWTVNAPDDMARMIDMQVDGLITDYPDRARAVMAAKGLALP